MCDSSSCRVCLCIGGTELLDQSLQALRPQPHGDVVGSHVDPCDQQADDACLLGREQLIRDVKRVHEDASVLVALGLIERTERGGTPLFL